MIIIAHNAFLFRKNNDPYLRKNNGVDEEGRSEGETRKKRKN